MVCPLLKTIVTHFPLINLHFLFVTIYLKYGRCYEKSSKIIKFQEMCIVIDVVNIWTFPRTYFSFPALSELDFSKLAHDLLEM